jgi:GNAT superfamily N-acetyltransferase
MLSKISFQEIFPIWKEHLWNIENKKIEPNSAMKFLGGYTLANMTTQNVFLAYKKDDKIMGVNSGHQCDDGSFRSRGLFVFHEYRKLGIGRLLLQETVNEAIKFNATFVWSYPRKSSWNAYKSVGFELASDWEECETSEANAYCKKII